MPNIEIHGMHRSQLTPMRLRIAELLNGADYKEKVVLMFDQTVSMDLKGRSVSFFRITAPRDDRDRVSDIENRLRPLGVGIEILYIERYVPSARETVTALAS